MLLSTIGRFRPSDSLVTTASILLLGSSTRTCRTSCRKPQARLGRRIWNCISRPGSCFGDNFAPRPRSSADTSAPRRRERRSGPSSSARNRVASARRSLPHTSIVIVFGASGAACEPPYSDCVRPRRSASIGDFTTVYVTLFVQFSISSAAIGTNACAMTSSLASSAGDQSQPRRRMEGTHQCVHQRHPVRRRCVLHAHAEHVGVAAE